MAGSRSIVVGAGVVGAAVALELLRSGRTVTLIDRDAPGMGASFGNMASIAVTEFEATSRPAVWRKMPGWMLDPEGPVTLRPLAVPRLLPWFWKFLLASRPERVRALEAAGAALCGRALQDTQRLLSEIGAEGMLSEEGCLALYAGEKELRQDRERLEMLGGFGFRHELLHGAALREIAPDLSPEITHVARLPDNRTVSDPHRFVTLIAERLKALGGEILRAEVAEVTRSERVSGVTLRDGMQIAADEVVLAAGVFTEPLARALGEKIPLVTERGYHTQIMQPGMTLDHALIWPARAFVVSPTAGGIRVGGTVELASIDAKPDWRRADVTLRHAQRALPGLQAKDTTRWMGHRPALPDTVPIISASARTRGLFYATGHGHLGLTNAATTARLIGQMIRGETPDIDLAPYRIDRY
jgi:D-amino-acid dehydrogenase